MIELTQADMDYILLITSMDAMRIKALREVEGVEITDFHYRVRHGLRKKLVEYQFNKEYPKCEHGNNGLCYACLAEGGV